MSLRTVAVLGAFLAAGLAGCTTPAPAIGPESYTLAALDLPSSTVAGTPFMFTLGMSGPEHTSTHIGAHYWTSSQDDPTGSLASAQACDHIADMTDLPVAPEVTCTFPSAGTWHLRGHLRVVADGVTYDYWTDEQTVEAFGDYELSATGIPAAVTAGTPFTFTLNITGPDDASSHVAGHWWSEATPDPTAAFGSQAGNCVITTEATLPGEFPIECTMEEPGTWHLRGHMLLSAGGATMHYWTAETAVTVADGMV